MFAVVNKRQANQRVKINIQRDSISQKKTHFIRNKNKINMPFFSFPLLEINRVA